MIYGQDKLFRRYSSLCYKDKNTIRYSVSLYLQFNKQSDEDTIVYVLYMFKNDENDNILVNKLFKSLWFGTYP